MANALSHANALGLFYNFRMVVMKYFIFRGVALKISISFPLAPAERQSRGPANLQGWALS